MPWTVELAIEVPAGTTEQLAAEVEPCTNIAHDETVLRNESELSWTVSTGGAPYRRIPADVPGSAWLSVFFESESSTLLLAPGEALVVDAHPGEVSWEVDQAYSLVALVQREMVQKAVDNLGAQTEAAGREILLDVYASNSPTRRALGTCFLQGVDLVEDDLPSFDDDAPATRLLAVLSAARKARSCVSEWRDAVDDFQNRFRDKHPRIAQLTDDFGALVDDTRWITALDDQAKAIMQLRRNVVLVARIL